MLFARREFKIKGLRAAGKPKRVVIACTDAAEPNDLNARLRRHAAIGTCVEKRIAKIQGFR